MSFGVVFPGQGSQRLGMLEEAAGALSVVSGTFSEASQAFGYDLWQLVSQGPAEKLGLTEHTQPAILTASVALFRAFTEANAFQPIAGAGHSLGEYSALVTAGTLSLGDGVAWFGNVAQPCKMQSQWVSAPWLLSWVSMTTSSPTRVTTSRRRIAL